MAKCVDILYNVSFKFPLRKDFDELEYEEKEQIIESLHQSIEASLSRLPFVEFSDYVDSNEYDDGE